MCLHVEKMIFRFTCVRQQLIMDPAEARTEETEIKGELCRNPKHFKIGLKESKTFEEYCKEARNESRIHIKC